MANLQIPEIPSTSELIRCLSAASNEIARLVNIIAQYEVAASGAERIYKRAYARAFIKHSGEKNATLTKAMADCDSGVCAAQDAYEAAAATLTLGKAELSGVEAQFVALRKIAELRNVEIKHGVG